MKRIICFFMCLFILPVAAHAEGIDGVNAKSSILIEQSTGMVLAEDEADERLPIASVTKIMTMLLIMERIDSGTLAISATPPMPVAFLYIQSQL